MKNEEFAAKWFYAGILVCSLILFTVTLSVTTNAAPAYPFPINVKQSDGTEITIQLRGDEWFSWAEDEVGHIIAYDENSNNWRYASIEGGDIVPSGSAVGEPFVDPSNLMEQPDEYVHPGIQAAESTTKIVVDDIQHHISQAERFDHSIFAQRNRDNERRIEPGNISSSNILVDQRILLLLIEFDNLQMVRNDRFYANKYFSTARNSVSVVNYFSDMSRGRRIFMPAVTTNSITQNRTAFTQLPGEVQQWVPQWARNGVNVQIFPSLSQGVVRVRLQTNHPIPSWNSSFIDVQAAVSLALSAIHNNTNFNFSTYGNNLHIGAVFAGASATHGFNPGGQVWGHAWYFDGSIVGMSGQQPYMAYGERMSESEVMGIGVSVHELAHSLGLPDLYDLTNVSHGIGPYCLMAAGSWGSRSGGASGHTPTALSAWAKMFLGYVEPIVVQADGHWRSNVNSNDFPTSNNYNVLRINHHADHLQYFLVENRNSNTQWDAGLWAWFHGQVGGVMIYHVDESMFSFPSPNNNWRRKFVDVEPANGSGFLDNIHNFNWRRQDHFFRADSFHSFNRSTNPNSNFYEPRRSTIASQEQGIQNVDTGISVRVHSNRANSMEVEVGTASERLTTNPPAQRIVSSRTTNSITVNATRPPNGWTIHYRIRTGSTGTWGRWRTSNTFTGLAPNTDYQFQARFTSINTTTHAHSAESPVSANIRTAVIQTTNAPAQRIVSSRTANSITVNATRPPNGWTIHYRIRTGSTSRWGSWQNSNIFTGLLPNTDYQIQARFTAINTTTHAHSAESPVSANIRTLRTIIISPTPSPTPAITVTPTPIQ